MKQIWKILKETIREFHRDSALQLAAAVAFYSALSLGPILIITLRVVGRIWGPEAVREQIRQHMYSVMDTASAATLEAVLKQADAAMGWNFAAVVGLATLGFSAMAVFNQLQNSMNKVWNAAPSRLGFWGFVKKRLMTLSMLLIMAAIVLTSLALSWALKAMAALAPQSLPGTATLLQVANFGISLAILTVVFASIFKILPDAEMAWKDVWLGALVTTLLFTLGKEVIAILLGRNSVADLYGAAGSMVLLLMWVYYSSVILFVGAEFTCVWSNRKQKKRA